ncbi:MAG: 6-pyruvoyl trahydropterin synthase family protein [Burkholderiales bacterium]
MPKFSSIRKHEIHAGHRVYGHPGKCQYLHGHSYIIHFYCSSNELDNLGMVVDFSIIKTTLCQWLEDNYDHRLLIWQDDPWAIQLQQLDSTVVLVPYNPTAENIAHHLLTQIAPQVLHGSGIQVSKITVEETSKCRASCELE